MQIKRTKSKNKRQLVEFTIEFLSKQLEDFFDPIYIIFYKFLVKFCLTYNFSRKGRTIRKVMGGGGGGEKAKKKFMQGKMPRKKIRAKKKGKKKNSCRRKVQL